MSLAIYPAFLSSSGYGLTYTVTRSPGFSTTAQDAPNGFQVRISNWLQPKYSWILEYDYLANNNALYKPPPSPYQNTTTMQAMLGFFNSKLGMGGSFLYNDPNFNSVGPGLVPITLVPNTFAELQVVNDGAGNYFSPIQIHIGGQSGTDATNGFWEDITDLQPSGGADHSALSVYDNGSLLTYGSQYSLRGPGLSGPGYSFLGLYLAFTYTPPGPITVTLNYYYRVTFNMDDLDIEQWSAFLHTIGGSQAKNGSGQLKLITARPPSV